MLFIAIILTIFSKFINWYFGKELSIFIAWIRFLYKGKQSLIDKFWDKNKPCFVIFRCWIIYKLNQFNCKQFAIHFSFFFLYFLWLSVSHGHIICIKFITRLFIFITYCHLQLRNYCEFPLHFFIINLKFN